MKNYSICRVLLFVSVLALGLSPCAQIWAETAPAIASETKRVFAVKVLKVLDGDTVSFEVAEGSARGTKLRVRLAGVDAPEVAHGPQQPGQPVGAESMATLKMLLPPGRRIELREVDTDRYSRLIGLVVVDGRLINAEQVRQGMAYAYRQYFKSLPAPAIRELEEAEAHAKAKKVGVWAVRDREMPWDYRRRVEKDK